MARHRREFESSHPLVALGMAKRMNPGRVMDWLQERGLVSDQAVSVEEIAPVDVDRVLTLANAHWAKPKTTNG